MRRALITGICGQDGAYLAKLLLEKGYAVYGITKQRTPYDNLKKLGLIGKVNIIDTDITDASAVGFAVKCAMPDEVYNLAAQSHVGHSFQCPQMTCSVNYMGYLNILLSARSIVPHAKIYQACTSEMFGYAASIIQNEETPLQPKSPYAIAKTAAYWAGVNARHEAGQFVANGILFNHESPLRHADFVTKKITNGVNEIMKYMHGVIQQPDPPIIKLGNIDSKRDWGYAGDYVEAMWLMLQHSRPDDFVIATGTARTVREFLSEAFAAHGKEITYVGRGEYEVGCVDGRIVMEIDPKLYRPNELGYLCGDATKAKEVLGWEPKMKFKQLVSEMAKQ